MLPGLFHRNFTIAGNHVDMVGMPAISAKGGLLSMARA